MGYPDEVYITLSENKDMVPFVSVVQYNGDAQNAAMITIGEITNFYNFTLLKPITAFKETPDNSMLPENHLMIYHRMRYIENKINRLRAKHRNSMRDFANKIIEFLQKWPPTDDNMIISVQMNHLKNYLTSDCLKVKCLITHFNFLKSLIEPIINSLPTKKLIIEELKIAIEEMSKLIDPRTSFFPLHKNQMKFERLYMSPLLPFADRIEELTFQYPPLDPQMFLQNLFQLVAYSLEVLGINRKPFDSTLVLLLVRLVFDRVYEKNDLLMNDGDDILRELIDITIGELSPPPDFSPPFNNDDEKVLPIFLYDNHFGKSVESLQLAVFHTNPFDILNCVDQALAKIEKAATIYNNFQTMVFPFEVTFELFMAVSICSQIRNWENLSVFIEQYTPMTGLCPSFEFSKAKIVASVMQFKTMIAEKNGDEIPEKVKSASDIAQLISDNITASRSEGLVTLPEAENVEHSSENEEEEEGLNSNVFDTEANSNSIENHDQQESITEPEENPQQDNTDSINQQDNTDSINQQDNTDSINRQDNTDSNNPQDNADSINQQE